MTPFPPGLSPQILRLKRAAQGPSSAFISAIQEGRPFVARAGVRGAMRRVAVIPGLLRPFNVPDDLIQLKLLPFLSRLDAVLPKLYATGDWKKLECEFADDDGFFVLPPDYESILNAKLPP